MPSASPSTRSRRWSSTSLWLALCAGAILTCSAARAQAPSALDPAAQAAERQQREQQDRQREEFRRARESARPPTTIETPDVPPARAGAAVTVRRDIREVRIEGATKLKPAELAELTSAYEGRAIGIEDVEQLLTEITKRYLAKGYVTTRAYIPEQDLSTGVLRILVVEGRIARLEGPNGVGNIFPVAPGQLLNLRDLEQGIDNLNRLRTHQATLDLAPGAQAGETNVIVRDQRSRRWHASFSADNTGSRDTGRYQASVTLSAEDLAGWGESVSVTHRQSVPYHSRTKASESTTASLNVPWGYQSFTLGGSAASYALSFPAPSGLVLPFDGSSRSLFLRADRVVYRGQTSRVGAYANLSWKSSRNYLAHTLITVSSRDTAVFDLGASYSRSLAGGFASFDASLSRGLPVFGAAEDPSGLPDFAPRSEFTALKLSASWFRSFQVRGRAFQFSSSLNGQVSTDVLYGSDQLTIGGIYAVRGFDRTNLAGDKGYVWRNDLSTTFRVPVGASRQAAALRPYVGVDQGYAWSNVSGLPGYTGPHGSLVGATAGLGLTYQRYSADLSYSQSLSRTAGMPREHGHFYFRVNATF